jgi:endonuclease/exonuclease/phosphatase family metal-dependent hydrolase
MSLLCAAALSICIAPGVADAAKKKGKAKTDKVGVMSYNLYLGSDLNPAVLAASQSRTDLFADEVGFVNKDVVANDFPTRAIQIAKDIKSRNVDLVGLQEAALWKVSIPPDLSSRAASVQYDYIQQLLDELNKGAKTAKQCKAAKSKAKKAGKKVKPCYQGYQLVISQQEADIEFPGDFDNDPGPDGVTFDVSDSAAFGAGAPAFWLRGNDDTGFSAGEPPAAQCNDGIDNDSDGLIDYGPTAGTHETSGPAAGDATPATGIQGGAAPYDCEHRGDNSETDTSAGTDASGLPQDANFDHHALAGNHPAPAGASTTNGTPFCPSFPTACPDSSPASPVSYDSQGAGRDAAGTTDCQDNSTDDGPEDATPGWPFSGAGYAENTVSVCMIHGLDGELSLTMRDAILMRKGAGVKTSNSKSGNFNAVFGLSVLGTPVNFTRGWTSTDANVRGKAFTFVNTHLESETSGTRQAQGEELVAPGGPATAPNTVLVGDLNSDPNGSSPGAYNAVANGGFRSLTGPQLTSGHGELLNDTSNTLDGSRIDHILTNSPGIVGLSSQVIDTFANGLWNSDHGGVFVQIKGKKKKAAKKKK